MTKKTEPEKENKEKTCTGKSGSEDSSKTLKEEIKDTKKELTELNTLDDRKKKIVTDKLSIKENISKMIEEIRTLRQERNTLTNEVRDIKKQREQVHTELKVKIEEAKEIQKGEKDIKKRLANTPRIDSLNRKLKQLEDSIETNPMSHDKEQQVMKKIKELRKQQKDSAEVSNFLSSMKHLNKDIKRLKKEGEAHHKQVQEKASLSQKKHEKLLELSVETDKLRKKEEKINEELLKVRREMNESSAVVGSSLSAITSLGKEIDEKRKREKSKRNRRSLEEKNLAVEEKIKRKQKLTTEDLLAFQANEE